MTTGSNPPKFDRSGIVRITSQLSRKRLPTFLIDRCLGEKFPDAFQRVGIPAQRIGEVYPDDAQFVQDVEWLQLAGQRGLPVLTQDLSIYTVEHEREAVEKNNVQVFCLADAEVRTGGRALIYGRHLLQILNRVDRPGPCFWVLGIGKAKKLIK